jgi:hypothetical protein
METPMVMPVLPTAADLRVKIKDAKSKSLDVVRKEVARVLNAFAAHIEKLLADPYQFTSHSVFGFDNPNYGDLRNKDAFYKLLKEALPSDYLVEASHDGGGMYEVALIRWNVKK